MDQPTPKTPAMTPQQALSNVAQVCQQFSGYSMAGAAAIQQSLIVLQEAITPARDAGDTGIVPPAK